jgi:RimJ/RimL family protein N-acetyltransferase
MNSLPEVDEYNTLGLPEHISITEGILRQWLADQQAEPRTNFVFGVMDSGGEDLVGMMGLRLGKLKYRIAEVWYKFFPEHWGKGYATECAGEVLRFGFNDLGLHRIEAGCAVENAGSIRVLEKSGFLREGRSRKILPIRGNWVDNYTYAILEEDFKK